VLAPKKHLESFKTTITHSFGQGIKTLVDRGRFDEVAAGANEFADFLPHVHQSMRDTCAKHGFLKLHLRFLVVSLLSRWRGSEKILPIVVIICLWFIC